MAPTKSHPRISRLVVRVVALCVIAAVALLAAWLVTVHTRWPVVTSSIVIGAMGGVGIFTVLRQWFAAGLAAAGAGMPAHAGNSARTRSRRTLLAWIFIAAVTAALLVQSLVMGRGLVNAGVVLVVPPWSRPVADVPVNRVLVDQTLVFAPERERMHREFLDGRFPLWNPNLACGLPGIGSIQSANLFPLNLLTLPISPFHASGWLAFVKLALAGGFTLLLARRLGLATLPATAAGVVFALGGFMVFWLNHPHVNSVMWLPLLLYCAEVMLDRRANDQRTLIVWLITALSFGFMLLGGHPPSMVHMLIIIAVYFCVRAIMLRRGMTTLSAAMLLASALLAGLVIASPQVLTYVEYNSLSSTSAASATLNRNAERFDEFVWLHYFMPYVSGSAMLMGPDLHEHFGMHEYMTGKLVYVGITTLLLCAVAVVCRGTRRMAWMWLSAAGIGLVIAHGVWPLPYLWSILPVLNQINHTRLIVVTTLALSITAGLGLAAFPAFITKRGLAITITLVALLSGALLIVWLRWRGGDLWTSPSMQAGREFLLRQIAVFVIPIVIFALLVALPGGRRMRWRQGVLVVVLAGELLWQGFGFNPAISRDQYYPSTPATQTIAGGVGPQRVLALAGVLQPNTASALNLKDARGVDFASLRRFEELMTGKAGDFYFRRAVEQLDRLTLLPGVEYVMTYPSQPPLAPSVFDRVYQGEVSVYRFRAAVPRAIVVHAAVVERDDAKALALMRDGGMNPTKAVLLESGEASGLVNGEHVNDAVEWLGDTPDEITLRVNAGEAGHLVLFDTWFPGWVADVNGVPARVYRADYAFRAVAVPAGVSTVQWSYRPLAFSLGATASIMTLTCFACIGLAATRRRHHAIA